MATSEAAAHAWDIVVHPRYRHTLPVQGPAAPARRHVDFAVLPVGVLHDIAGRLATAQDLLRFEQVNKPCRRAASDEAYWKRLCTSKFSIEPGIMPPSWKKLYRFNHEFFYKTILRATASDRLGHVRGPVRIAVFA